MPVLSCSPGCLLPVVLGLALWSGGLVIACRGLLCAALRAAHRRGLLTEPAVIIGTGTFGAYSPS